VAAAVFAIGRSDDASHWPGYILCGLDYSRSWRDRIENTPYHPSKLEYAQVLLTDALTIVVVILAIVRHCTNEKLTVQPAWWVIALLPYILAIPRIKRQADRGFRMVLCAIAFLVVAIVGVACILAIQLGKRDKETRDHMGGIGPMLYVFTAVPLVLLLNPCEGYVLQFGMLCALPALAARYLGMVVGVGWIPEPFPFCGFSKEDIRVAILVFTMLGDIFSVVGLAVSLGLRKNLYESMAKPGPERPQSGNYVALEERPAIHVLLERGGRITPAGLD
jgi:hypothetical protein